MLQKCGNAKVGLVAEHCCSVFLLLYMLKVSVLRWMQFRTREIRSSNEPSYCAWLYYCKIDLFSFKQSHFFTESISFSTLSLVSLVSWGLVFALVRLSWATLLWVCLCLSGFVWVCLGLSEFVWVCSGFVLDCLLGLVCLALFSQLWPLIFLRSGLVLLDMGLPILICLN